jgi:hypothetical protein
MQYFSVIPILRQTTMCFTFKLSENAQRTRLDLSNVRNWAGNLSRQHVMSESYIYFPKGHVFKTQDDQECLK